MIKGKSVLLIQEAPERDGLHSNCKDKGAIDDSLPAYLKARPPVPSETNKQPNPKHGCNRAVFWYNFWPDSIHCGT